jgi:acetyl esterase/lipase
MPAGRTYLLSSVLGALNTVNAVAPRRRPPAAAIAGFATGLPTSEFPLHTLALQAATTAGLVRRGALGTRSGRAGLALSAASWAGLIALHRQATQARGIFELALQEAFAADRQWLEAAPAPEPQPVLTVGQLAVPGRGSRRRYLAGRDLSYGDAGVRNQLDVWCRADVRNGTGAPVLLQIPGGAWITGKKEGQAYPLMSHLAERGWVCVAMNYRLSPKASWPDHIVDVKRAIGWVKASIAAYGGNPDFIAVTGGSAGGHLSALAALTANDPLFQPGFEDVDTTVQAAVPLYGPYDIADVRGTGDNSFVPFWEQRIMKRAISDDDPAWYAASPIARVNQQVPPFFVIHGANDTLVPVDQARSFVKELRAVSDNPVAYAELPGAQHAFDLLRSPRTTDMVHAVHRFLTVIHSHAAAGTRAADPPATTDMAIATSGAPAGRIGDVSTTSGNVTTTGDVTTTSGNGGVTSPAAVVAGAEPWSCAGGSVGALVLHGFTGNPQSMRGLAEAFARAGFATELPRLPGHGTSVADLAATSWADWSAAAEAAYDELARRCDKVVVAGLSMGGTLTCWLAARHPEIAAIAVINGAVMGDAGTLAQALDEMMATGTSELPAVGNDIADEGVVELAYDTVPIKALRSLLVAVDQLQPSLAAIKCPVLILNSPEDHVVAPEASAHLAQAVSGPVERVSLDRSYHVATLDYDKDLIETSTVEFCRRVTDAG